MLSEPDNLRSITNRLLTDKVIQRLVDIAKGEAPPLEELDQEPTPEGEVVEVETESTAAEPIEPDAEETAPEELETVSVDAEAAPGAEDV
jgi:hypothetical protein